MSDTDPVFGPNDRPARILSAEEVKSLIGYESDLTDLIDKGYAFGFYDTKGVLRIGLTRRGIDASTERKARPC